MAAQSSEETQALYWVPEPTGGEQSGMPLVWGAQWAAPPHTGTGFSGSQVPLLEVELVDELVVEEVELELVDEELDDEVLDEELLVGVQEPFWHSSPPMHNTSQEPQWELLAMMSTQIPPQSISLGPQPLVPELVELAPPVPVEVEPPVPLVDVEVLLAPP